MISRGTSKGMKDNKSIIILIGPPGSGKGTQAELIAEKFGFYHFETSKVIEEKFKNADPNDKEMREEYEKFSSGQLNTPSKVRQWVIDRIEDLAQHKTKIVFSSSPRTLYEAEGECPFLEKYYNKNEMIVFNIEVSEEESIRRNSGRRICEKSRHPIPDFDEYKNIKTCPKDGSKIITRILDKPDIIKVRYATYVNETKPVLDFFKKADYEVVKINGDQSISDVHTDIIKKI
jgi:adenylate kinase